MKVKHRNYWSFFWRVGAGFLAFWVAAMGVATGLAAQRYRDSVRDVVQGYVQDVETTAHEAEQAAPRDAQEMLYSACNEWLQPAVSMAAVFDRERNLAAHTGNYLAGRGCYLDMDRWLTDEEQEALVTVYQQNTGFGYQAENEGKEYYGLSVDGWLDGVMLIPGGLRCMRSRLSACRTAPWSSGTRSSRRRRRLCLWRARRRLM